jgi:hypothetical protein
MEMMGMNSPEMAVMLPVLTIAGSLIGAFGGVWLGRYLERRNEAMKWRRDRLLDAYSEFLRAVNIATVASAKAFEIPCETPEHEKQRETAFEKVTEIRRVSDRILLLSSDSVGPPFESLRNFIATEYVWGTTNCPKAASLDRKLLGQQLNILLTSFTESARDDLGIHPPSRVPPEPVPGWDTSAIYPWNKNKSWWRFWS